MRYHCAMNSVLISMRIHCRHLMATFHPTQSLQFQVHLSLLQLGEEIKYQPHMAQTKTLITVLGLPWTISSIIWSHGRTTTTGCQQHNSTLACQKSFLCFLLHHPPRYPTLVVSHILAKLMVDKRPRIMKSMQCPTLRTIAVSALKRRFIHSQPFQIQSGPNQLQLAPHASSFLITLNP